MTPERLLGAYMHGVFPWFNDDSQPIAWWSPDPRAVLAPSEFRVSRSLAKRLRAGFYRVTMDAAFARVVAGCAAPRADAEGTWITPRMGDAYLRLHELGFAHSVEAWRGDALAGGLYGVSLGRLFFGESMFSRMPDASKAALAHLARQAAAWGFALIDCQFMTRHLRSLGAEAMPRRDFLRVVAANGGFETRRGAWTFDADLATQGWRMRPRAVALECALPTQNG